MSMNSKIITGVLVDKPIFSILGLFKKDHQTICSLNEFFHFHPYPGFDYCNLDVYYSLNSMDRISQNRIGGKIQQYVDVSFIRNQLKSNSYGISEELNKLSCNYKKTILILTSQIPNWHYFNQLEDVKVFVDSIIELSSLMTSYLFIIKEKKNELDSIEIDVLNKLKRRDNIYLIRSKIPRKLKYNQFEDLLKISHLTISSVFVSTTIWQSLSNNIPSIGFSRYSVNSFMNNFKFLNVGKNEIYEAVNYWLNISKVDFENFLNNLYLTSNISSKNGLKEISNSMEQILLTKK